MHHGVYAIHPPPYSREQIWMAAVLACGAGAMLSDWPAVAHWRIATENPDLSAHVTVGDGRNRCRPGITIHRRGPTDPRDYAVKDSIPITAPHLTLIHLAPALSASELEVIAVAAESLGLLKRGRLSELVTERRSRPGIHKLLPLLASRPRPIRSDLELLFFPIVELAGLPRPLINHPIPVPGREKPLIVDVAWPEIQLVVELDSQRFHGDWERAEIDRDRDQVLALAGHLCHRFVRRVVANERSATAERLGRLHAIRRAERPLK